MQTAGSWNWQAAGGVAAVNNSTGCLNGFANGDYYLAISSYDHDPVSAGGLIFPEHALHHRLLPDRARWGPAHQRVERQREFHRHLQHRPHRHLFPPAAPTCYANCDSSTTPPVLNVADFTCFLQKLAANDPYANCDGSTTPPTLSVADFTCFLQKFAAGCSAP